MSSITYTNKPDRSAVFPSCRYCFCYLVSFEMLFFNLLYAEDLLKPGWLMEKSKYPEEILTNWISN